MSIHLIAFSQNRQAWAVKARLRDLAGYRADSHWHLCGIFCWPEVRASSPHPRAMRGNRIALFRTRAEARAAAREINSDWQRAIPIKVWVTIEEAGPG